MPSTNQISRSEAETMLTDNLHTLSDGDLARALGAMMGATTMVGTCEGRFNITWLRERAYADHT